MSGTPYEYVSGWTGPIDQQLVGDQVPPDLTGMTLALILTDSFGAAVDTAGKVSFLDAATAKVRFLPGAADLDHTKSPYLAHWKVTDSGGKVVFFPSGEADVWRVFRP